MLKADIRRMFTQRLLYIMIGICLAVPILVLTVTSMFGDGAVMFSSVWQSIGAVSGGNMLSKILAGSVAGIMMLIAYFCGAIIGGAVAGLSFDINGFTVTQLIFCLLAKKYKLASSVSVRTDTLFAKRSACGYLKAFVVDFPIA